MTRLTQDKEHELLAMLDALNAPLATGGDLSARTGEFLRQLGLWEVAHRLRTLPAERAGDVQAFVEYVARAYPAAADRIQILLSATKGEDRELVKRDFGGD